MEGSKKTVGSCRIGVMDVTFQGVYLCGVALDIFSEPDFRSHMLFLAFDKVMAAFLEKSRESNPEAHKAWLRKVNDGERLWREGGVAVFGVELKATEEQDGEGEITCH